MRGFEFEQVAGVGEDVGAGVEDVVDFAGQGIGDLFFSGDSRRSRDRGG